MSRAFVSRYRFYFVVTMVIMGFLCVVGRLTYLHIFAHRKYIKMIEQNRGNFQVLYSRRGDILDSKGAILATTRAVMEIGVDPQMIRPQDEKKAVELASLLKISIEEVKSSFREKTRFGTDKQIRFVRWKKLADAVDEATYEKIKALGIKGVYGNKKFERVYPCNGLAAHILGFINKEDNAVMGIEHFMDFYLRGQNGWIESEKDGKRQELAQFRVREVLPMDGYSIELTIDQVVQSFVEEELDHIMQEFSPIACSIIITEPKTGYILALGNRPSFNPNEFNKANIEVLKNRAVTDLYEPGSTFKIVTTSAAINEGVIRLEEPFDCGLSTVDYKGRTLKLPKDWHPLGVLKATEVLRQSSNRGLAQIGMRLGEERLYNYARAFGFGELTGFGMDGEIVGILHKVKDWDTLTITRVPMGHAVGATLMQVHYAMTVIANGGLLMKPQSVRRIFDKEGVTFATFEPQERRRVVSKHTTEVISNILENSATKALVKGFKMVGKSGTSQKVVNGHYSSTQHVSSFTGFVPKINPSFVMTIVVDGAHFKGGTAYGSHIAAPSFKRISEKMVQYLGLKPEEEDKK